MVDATRSSEETQAVRAAHQFDEGKLAEYLAANLDGFAGPLTVRQFPGGLSNPTYMLETPKKKYVLRRKPPGVLLKSAHAVDREYRVMSALHGVGFPVPKPLVLCGDDSVIGTMFFVMDYVPGRIFIRCAMPELGRAERTKIYDAMNETLASLRRVDFNAIGLGDYGRPGNYFARQIARWTTQYEQSKTQEIPEMDRLIQWLPTAVPPENPPSIVHGDFSFHNVLFHPTEARVMAVVDWELSTLGDPFGDLTYHGMEWYRPSDSDGRGSLRDEDLNALGVPTFDEYARTYCRRAGLPEVKDMSFYRAYNLFRVAAIVQGVVGRAVAAKSPAADEQAWRVRPIARAAWDEVVASGNA